MLEAIQEAFTPNQGWEHPYRVIEKALEQYVLEPAPEQAGAFSDRVFEELCRQYKTDTRLSKIWTLFDFQEKYPLELFWIFVKFGGRIDTDHRLRLLNDALRAGAKFQRHVPRLLFKQASDDRTQRLTKFKDETTLGTDHHVDVDFEKRILNGKTRRPPKDPYTDFIGPKKNEFLSIGKLTSWGYNEQDLDGYLLKECMKTGFPYIKAIYIPETKFVSGTVQPRRYLYQDTDDRALNLHRVGS